MHKDKGLMPTNHTLIGFFSFLNNNLSQYFIVPLVLFFFSLIFFINIFFLISTFNIKFIFY